VTVKSLKDAGYCDADVIRFWREIWLQDWRWKTKRDHPRPSQLRSEIFRLRAQSALAADAATPPTAKELSREDQELVVLLQEASKRERPNQSGSLLESLDLSHLQRYRVGVQDR
jgi:hypothetical protein